MNARAGQRRLAHFEGFSPEVFAVQFQQVEGVEGDVPSRWLLAQQLEHGQAVLVAGDRLAVDQAERTLSTFTASTMSGYRGAQ
jgi:hypothetical protein